jgi:glycine/D-amino acid oxidase-like deaminating enzyme
VYGSGWSGRTHGIDVADGHRSPWLATTEGDEFPALQGGIEVDVAVVGGGITGVTVAHLLKREGKSVALLEMRRVGLGTTGHTTAKLTVGHSLVYAKLSASHGPDAARRYAESNREAISQMAALAIELGINCAGSRPATTSTRSRRGGSRSSRKSWGQ